MFFFSVFVSIKAAMTKNQNLNKRYNTEIQLQIKQRT
jgi:hypothetical protein